MKYHIEKITADNRRPGMKHQEGYLVRYRPHPSYGWTGLRTFDTQPEAETFTGTLTQEGDLPA
jgi:hypothetical protein